MSCFITYHTMSSAVQYPWRMHASGMDLGLHQVTLCEGHSQLHCVLLECASCRLRYRLVLDWLSGRECSGAIDRV